MVSVVLIISVFNVALGFGLAVMLEKPIVIPLPRRAPRRARQPSSTGAPADARPSIPPVLDREVEAELIPETWLQVFEGSDIAAVALLESPIRTVCANITAYREVIARTEGVFLAAVHSGADATCEGALAELAQHTEQWSRQLTAATNAIESHQGEWGDYARIADRLLRVVARQAAGFPQKSQTITARWQQGRHEDAIVVLNEIVASLFRLRDIVMETLVIIMREENRLDVFDRRQHYDVLTRLHNRLGVELVFRNWRREEVNTHRGLSVALLDIDRFAEVNRRLSARVGDRVLGIFGRLLDSLLTNDFGLYHVFRLSGQQFLAFFADTSRDDAAALVEDIRHGIEATHFMVEQQAVSLTLTACVTEVPPSEGTGELFDRLDGLCELAKQTGQNRVYLGHDSELELVPPTGGPAEAREIRVM